MNTQEKLNLIAQYRYHGLVFFKEGNFWKCYNEHAMFFVKNIKDMKLHTRYYKNVKKYIHSIGFPNVALAKYEAILIANFAAEQVAQEASEYICFANCQWKNTCHYQVWEEPLIQKKEKEQNPPPPTQPPMSIEEEIKINGIYQLLRNYEIEKASPLDAFKFLLKIKQYID